MSQNMLGSHVEFNFVDKRRSGTADAISDSFTTGETIFTSNAVGTTTTLVGADGVPATADTNVVRRGEKFRLFNSAGVVKEDTVFTIDSLSSTTGTTTVTFSPAAAVATASGDVAKLVGTQDYLDEDTLDDRLTALDSTSYTAARLRSMTQNDKIYALRLESDPGSF